ncbi:hypothetical protein QYE76_070838 [Lolium multiflorum]|uniref:Retrotransposon gag domain-containing protein n=1 Tax=Lolium multiflorum TaxID=4521 RepID=A0AAD8SK48_LOLMU|nr:hypothetical protein QYE76_070838 [Lolium multiflorum]
MADGTPVTYEDLTDELKKKYDEVKAILEADHRLFSQNPFTWHQVEGVLARWCARWDRPLCPVGRTHQVPTSDINYMVAHSCTATREPGEHFGACRSPGDPGDHEAPVLRQTSSRDTPRRDATQSPSTAAILHKNADPPIHSSTRSVVTLVTASSCMRRLRRSLTAQLLQLGSELEKQAWLAKYATPANLRVRLQPKTVDGSHDLGDQFGMVPKRRTIGYSKPYPDEYELVPLPPKYRLPDFSKFSGSDGSSSIEHVSRYLAQLGTASASDPLRVRFFAQSLTGSAFGWYTSLPPDSIRTWKQLEEQFHMQYHSEASESGLADLAQIRQKRGETVAEYVQRFRNLRNRCYSARVTEKEAVELAVVGLASQIKDMASQADYPSLAHMVQKLSAYEQRHPDLYQDKFKRAVVLVEADEDEDSAGDQEVVVAEWTRGANPVSCKWVKPPGPPRGFDFDVTKTEQTFDLLLKEKQLKIPEGLKFPTCKS